MKILKPEGKAIHSGLRVDSYGGNHKTDTNGNKPFDQAALRKGDGRGKSKQEQRKHLHRAKLECVAGNRPGEDDEHDHPDHAADEGGNGRNSESGAGSSLFGHGITVKAADNGRGVSRSVDHDGRARPAKHGAVINRAHGNQGCRRFHIVGNGDQNGDACGGAKTGEHSHNGSEQTADKDPYHITRCKGFVKSERQIVEDTFHLGLPP